VAEAGPPPVVASPAFPARARKFSCLQGIENSQNAEIFVLAPSGAKNGFRRVDSLNSGAAGSSSANDAGGIPGKHGATGMMRNFPACNALKTQEMRKFSPSSPRRSADGARRGCLSIY
jgi:hypothetical protein